MKLLSLEIQARGSAGWQSEKLQFGSHITQLYGPNGCGKTPMIQAIVYALGHKMFFRDDINDNCESVLLTLSFDGQSEYLLKRAISRDFYVEYSSSNGTSGNFHNELEFATFLFDKLNIEKPRLTSVQNKPTYAYTTLLLPLFYLDQDNGYSDQYYSPAKFIKDQYSEVARLAIGVTPKHSFDRKRDIILANQNLETTTKQIVQSESFLESLYSQLSNDDRSSESISKEIEITKGKLDDLRDSSGVGQRASEAVYQVINSKTLEKSQYEKQIAMISQQVDSFSTIGAEIEAEIATLNLNESARRVFDTFDEICGSSSCGLFVVSSESYAKHLLYLKDQLKDLHRYTESQSLEIETLSRLSSNLTDEISTTKKELETIEANNFAEHIALATKELMTRLFELEKQKQIAVALENEKRKFFKLSEDRESLQNKVASLSGQKLDTDLDYMRFRQNFKSKILEWMNVLETKNVSRDILIDSDLKVVFGSEKLTVHKGSTLLRLVLAIRAAYFECSIETNPDGFNFLVFDTPKQQDIETIDFAKFVDKLKLLCSKSHAQVIFSTTEYRYTPDKNDIEWSPKFKGKEQDMFLMPLRQSSTD